MRRRAVEVEVVLLHVLAVIAFAVGQAEQPLLENRILAVPEGEGEAEPLLVVGDAGQAVFAPAIGARARLIVGEIIPGVAAFAVVFADRAPLALAEVRPPFFPGSLAVAGGFEAEMFGGHGFLAMFEGPMSGKVDSFASWCRLSYSPAVRKSKEEIDWHGISRSEPHSK